MEGGEAIEGELPRPAEMTEVGPRVVATCEAVAGRIDRAVIAGEPRVSQVDPMPGRTLEEDASVTGEPCRSGAVERVDSAPHRGEQVLDLTDPEQVARPGLGEQGNRPLEHPQHLLLRSAERSTDRVAGEAHRADDAGALLPQIAIRSPLDDSVQALLRVRVRGVLLEQLERRDRTPGPAVGPLHRPLRVPVVVER